MDTSDFKQKHSKNFDAATFLMERLIQFSYTIKPTSKKKPQLSSHNGLDYLGYSTEALQKPDLLSWWHPSEQQQLESLEQHLMEFAKVNAIPNGDLGVVLVHRIRKSNNQYIKILRVVFPDLSAKKGEAALHSYCLDITPHCTFDKISLQIVTKEAPDFDVAAIRERLLQVLATQGVRFTLRQLECLKAWMECETVKIAADKIGIEARTMETHLKNARKRLGVKRTMDAMMYAKRKGWI